MKIYCAECEEDRDFTEGKQHGFRVYTCDHCGDALDATIIDLSDNVIAVYPRGNISPLFSLHMKDKALDTEPGVRSWLRAVARKIEEALR